MRPLGIQKQPFSQAEGNAARSLPRQNTFIQAWQNSQVRQGNVCKSPLQESSSGRPIRGALWGENRHPWTLLTGPSASGTVWSCQPSSHFPGRCKILPRRNPSYILFLFSFFFSLPQCGTAFIAGKKKTFHNNSTFKDGP